MFFLQPPIYRYRFVSVKKTSSTAWTQRIPFRDWVAICRLTLVLDMMVTLAAQLDRALHIVAICFAALTEGMPPCLIVLSVGFKKSYIILFCVVQRSSRHCFREISAQKLPENQIGVKLTLLFTLRTSPPFFATGRQVTELHRNSKRFIFLFHDHYLTGCLWCTTSFRCHTKAQNNESESM